MKQHRKSAHHILAAGLLAGFAIVVGCGTYEGEAEKGGTKKEGQGSHAVNKPVNVATSTEFRDASFEAKTAGNGLGLVSASGEPIQLTLFRDYRSATGGKDEGYATFCTEVLPGDKTIGMAECADDREKSVPILVKNVTQVCTPTGERTSPTEALAIADCDQIKLRYYKTEPHLEIWPPRP